MVDFRITFASSASTPPPNPPNPPYQGGIGSLANPVRFGNRTYRARGLKIWLKNGKLNSPEGPRSGSCIFFRFMVY